MDTTASPITGPPVSDRSSPKQILVIPFHDVGHTFPATELSHRLAARGFRVKLFLPTSASVPPAVSPLIEIVPYPLPPPPPHPPSNAASIDTYILTSTGVSFAIIDVMMDHLFDSCRRRNIPVAALFTSSACSAALEHVAHSFRRSHTDSGRDHPVISIPGIPEEMTLTPAYLRRRPRGRPAGRGPHRRRAGLAEMDGAAVFVFNTCDDLERPFLAYISACTGKPTWGVGPLLAAKLDRGETDPSRVLNWLDRQPVRSVLYVCFGSRVGPNESELRELTTALCDSEQRFVWVVRFGTGLGPLADEVEARVGERGVVIRGWAPQMLILDHRATGAFLTHCGWNSTVEAAMCGLPMLTWPVQGDQIHNASLVTRWLKVGRALGVDDGRAVSSGEVTAGIKEVIGDDELRARAEELRKRLEHGGGCRASSEASLDALCGFLGGE